MIRRVVTGLSEQGEPRILDDGTPPRTHIHTATPGMVNSLVWATPARPTSGSEDTTAAVASVLPAPGETRAMVVTFPPDAVYAEPGFDPAAADAEQLAATPGLAELFERDAPGMHTTPTVDYAVILNGRLTLDLGRETTTLEAGDVVVQNGTRHAWRNAGDEPASVFFVLIGAVSANREDDPR